MSSYQFVNSLPSCYPQPNHPSGTNNNNSSTSSGTNQTANSDYFPSAYTPNLYPNTPQAHYGNQAYNLGGQQNPDMVDYTQLQPQRLLMPNQPQQQQQQPQQQNAPQTLNPNSCKYGSDGINTNNNNSTPSIASPQDLSTAREISPKLSPSSVVESVARQLNKNSSVSSTNQTNPLGLNNNVSHTTVPLSMHSPNGGDSESDSESGNEAGGSQNGSGKKGSQPEIYPWMKRVHLGQSKFSKSILISI